MGYTENQYSTCSAAILNRIKSFDISISKILSTVGGCPNLVRTNASENSKGFICSSEKKKVTVGGKDYCRKSEMSHLLFWFITSEYKLNVHDFVWLFIFMQWLVWSIFFCLVFSFKFKKKLGFYDNIGENGSCSSIVSQFCKLTLLY